MRLLYIPLLTLLGATAIADAQIPAQSSPPPSQCTYDSCALWIGKGSSAGGSAAVLKGANGVTATSGGRKFDVPVLATAGGNAQKEYEASRKRYRIANRASAFVATAVGATIVRLLAGRTNWGTTADVALPAALVGFGATSSWAFASAEDHLRRAIWYYNGTLPSDAGKSSSCAYEQCALRVSVSALSSRVVSGVAEKSVTLVGEQPLPAELFTGAGDSARVHADSFWVYQRRANSGATADRIFIVSSVSGLVITAAGAQGSAKQLAWPYSESALSQARYMGVGTQ